MANTRNGHEAVARNIASVEEHGLNLTYRGQEALSTAAAAFLTADDDQVSALCAAGDINEVNCDAHENA